MQLLAILSVLTIVPGEVTTFPRGEGLTIQGTKVVVTFARMFEATPCASPTNCGAGYGPPQPEFTVSGCTPDADCPWAVVDVTEAAGTVKATVIAATPSVLKALRRDCRAGDRKARDTVQRLSRSGQLSGATQARLWAAIEGTPEPLPPPGPQTAERRCPQGDGEACLALVAKVPPEQRLILATRACFLSVAAGCAKAVELLGNESSKRPEQVMRVIELGCDRRLSGYCEEYVRRLRLGVGGVVQNVERAKMIDSQFRASSAPVKKMAP